MGGCERDARIENDLLLRDTLDKHLKNQPFKKNIFYSLRPVDSSFFENLMIIFRELEEQNVSLIDASAQPLSIDKFITQHFSDSAELQTQMNDLFQKAKNQFQIQLKMTSSQCDKDEVFVAEAKLFLLDVISKLPSFWDLGLIDAQEIKACWGAYQYLLTTNSLLSEKLPLDIPILKVYQIDSVDCLQHFLQFLEKTLTLPLALKSVQHHLQRKNNLLQITLQMTWQSLAIKNLSDALSIEKSLNATPFNRQEFLITLEEFKSWFYSNMNKYSTKIESFMISDNEILKAISMLEEILISDEAIICRNQIALYPIEENSLPNELWEFIFAELAKSSPEQLSQLTEDPNFKKIWKTLKGKPNSPVKTIILPRNGVWSLGQVCPGNLGLNTQAEKTNSQIIECQNNCLVSVSPAGTLIQWRLNDKGIYESQLLHSASMNQALSSAVLELKNGVLVSADSRGWIFFWHFDKNKNTYELITSGDLNQGAITTLFELSNGSVVSFSAASSSIVHTVFDKKTNKFMHAKCDAMGCIQLKDASLMLMQPTEIISMVLNQEGLLEEQEKKILSITSSKNITSMIELQDGSFVIVINNKSLNRWVYNNENQKFEKKHVGESDEKIQKILQLKDGSLLTCSVDSKLTCWVLNSETNTFKIKQKLEEVKLDIIKSIVQLYDKSLLCVTMKGVLVLWKLNSQHKFFSKPIYLEGIASADTICQLRDESLMVMNETGTLSHYTFKTLKEIFKETKVLLNMALKSALQKNDRSSLTAEFLNTPDPLEKQKCYLRTVLSGLPSILIGNGYVEEQEIKIFLGAYQYLVFKDSDLQKNDGKQKQFLKLMEAALASPVFALYKDDKTCLQAFADFLLDQKNLQPIFDEARLYFYASQKSLGNI